MIRLFREKKITQAIQWDGTDEGRIAMLRIFGLPELAFTIVADAREATLMVPTPRGLRFATAGYFIVRDPAYFSFDVATPGDMEYRYEEISATPMGVPV